MGGGICSYLAREGATIVVSDLNEAAENRRAEEIQAAGGTSVMV